MKNKPVVIPVEQIDSGIILCLYSSRRLNHISKILLERNPREYPNEIVIVLYYYALEEFGKALYLIKLKKETTDSKVEAYLYDHNIKIHAAIAYNPELKIRKLIENKKGIVSDTDFFREWIEWKLSDEEIINGFFERSSLWLVDYDVKNKKWKEMFDFIDSDEVLQKIELLDKEIDKFQKEYNRNG